MKEQSSKKIAEELRKFTTPVFYAYLLVSLYIFSRCHVKVISK
jgi:hypothetical protein